MWFSSVLTGFLQYCALDITYFKSSLDSHLLDLLWNKYWVNTLSSSPLLGNRDYVAGQIFDLGKHFIYDDIQFLYSNYYICSVQIISCTILPFAADKLEQAEGQLAHSRFGGMIMPSQRKKEVSFFICVL